MLGARKLFFNHLFLDNRRYRDVGSWTEGFQPRQCLIRNNFLLPVGLRFGLHLCSLPAEGSDGHFTRPRAVGKLFK